MSTPVSPNSSSNTNLLKQTAYQKNGNIFFRTTIQKAMTFEQTQLDAAKAKLQKLGSS